MIFPLPSCNAAHSHSGVAAEPATPGRRRGLGVHTKWISLRASYKRVALQ